LLYETGLFPDLEYSFTHALTLEVAYGGLLQERRRALHARILDALETVSRDRPAGDIERLAHHALRGELWEPAVGYLEQAGHSASARYAIVEAIGYYDQALAALAHLPEQKVPTREGSSPCPSRGSRWRCRLRLAG
jgi:predicted ATPase